MPPPGDRAEWPTTHAELKAFVGELRSEAQVLLRSEAERLGLAGDDPFVDALAAALGDISLEEAVLALTRKAGGEKANGAITACRGCGQSWYHKPRCPVEAARHEPSIVHRVRAEDCE